jgi:hypothetical protein
MAAAVAARQRARFTWDGSDRDGRAVSPGVYFLRAVGQTGSASLKVAVMR